MNNNVGKDLIQRLFRTHGIYINCTCMIIIKLHFYLVKLEMSKRNNYQIILGYHFVKD